MTEIGGCAVEETFERRLDAKFIVSIFATGMMSFAGIIVELSMNIAFPELMEEFSLDTATVQWITTGYMLVVTMVMPLSAYLKRRFKMRSLFVASAALFLVGCILCAVSPNFPLLIVGRLVQGVGTGISMPLMYNIVIEQAPLKNMGLMMSIATCILCIGPALGPTFGGFVMTHVGWRMVFVVLIPCVAVTLLLGLWSIRQSSSTGKPTFPAGQFVLLSASFACLVFAINAAGTAGWFSTRVLCLIAAFAVFLALFCAASLRSTVPLVHIEVFKRPTYTLSILYVFLVELSVLALVYLIPNYAELTCGFDEFSAGLLLIPGFVVGMVIEPFCGRLLDTKGAKKPVLFGSCLFLAAMILFAVLGVDVDVRVLALVYILVASGESFSVSNSMTNGLAHLPKELRADGNASYTTLQQLSTAIGTAVGTSIVNAAQANAPDLATGTLVGAEHVFATLLCLSVVALAINLVSFFFVQKRDKAVA